MRERWVSSEAARDIYRVSLDTDGCVDAAGTCRLRAADAAVQPEPESARGAAA